MTSKFKPSIDTVKEDDGTILCESEEVKRRWQEYCTKLYQKNCDVDEPQLPPFVDPKEEPPPLYSEVEKAIKELRVDLDVVLYSHFTRLESIAI